jgi:hypothetical protein
MNVEMSFPKSSKSSIYICVDAFSLAWFNLTLPVPGSPAVVEESKV